MSSRKRGRRPASAAVTEIPVQNLVNDKFTLVRIDAPPHVEIREGVYVTVQGQVSGLKEAARQLSNPRPRPHSLPDIVFLPSSTRILALDEVVPAKPHVLVRSDDLDKARALQHSGNVIGNLSVNNRSHSHSLTHTVVSSGTATVGVLTPPPTNKNKSSGGISGLLDAADRVREEDDMDARKKGKLSPRELTFDDGDDAVYELERAVKAEDGAEVEKRSEKERPAREEPTPQSKVTAKNVG